MCTPGTDKPIRAAEGQAWHNLVVAAIQHEQVPTACIVAFCEIAGVEGAQGAEFGLKLEDALTALNAAQRKGH